ncbi:MAG: type II toxin-antitoxin system mRNA interferase toxin, RelE/StbE family [Patescibacteria group bacterium]|nr:type II toxin-antitoxin system mRNA interferase toxin, RelE/StbE family [Patescibacteria group bacterium]MDE1944153.1 type II toxin-antitoxin system mRNA interferase toxin, RelE/StbE family [Patescibacteria group bacterium]MDE1945436.1 type II toxin-antitoxin system mRNA interferase toxin, RelE/StbE family [Patescibacteria group bacterium]MDE2057953.1 type II toxin-antitoxin system mRNA interferase toxin, RelE/StbE family [Patescibacteria group bacterium]
MRLYFSARFKKKRARLPHPLQAKLDERLTLFAREPFDPILNNHQLHGKYAGYRSIDIMGDYRAMYDPVGESGAHFILHGTHAELYGK